MEIDKENTMPPDWERAFAASKAEERLKEANHLLCQIVIASASGFLGDPAKRKTEAIVRAAEYLDSTGYQFQCYLKEDSTNWDNQSDFERLRAMLVTNTKVDWDMQDAAEEFQAILNFIDNKTEED